MENVDDIVMQIVKLLLTCKMQRKEVVVQC